MFLSKTCVIEVTWKEVHCNLQIEPENTHTPLAKSGRSKKDCKSRSRECFMSPGWFQLFWTSIPRIPASVLMKISARPLSGWVIRCPRFCWRKHNFLHGTPGDFIFARSHIIDWVCILFCKALFWRACIYCVQCVECLFTAGVLDENLSLRVIRSEAPSRQLFPAYLPQ